ncbi:A24 family peptidase [Actinoallomurus purpureus]|uniref:prepilin peptidase n=1 Tax=Actinoallomurus purpureus TaxID=478114 RepID=UPI002092EF42|nr:A24 family peptidase [Actinoallomurus purpureus]MCO6005815.1 A24 family peptidase [Actinoallomurus purpureus]
MTTPDWAEPVIRRRLGVIAATVVVLALVTWRVGPAPDLPAFVCLAVAGVALTFIDIALKRLPDPVTLPSYAVGLLLLGMAALFTHDGGVRFAHALAGMVALFALYALQWLIAPNQIGLGDVKLAGVLGLYLGWLGLSAWVAGVCAGYVLAAVYSIGLLASRRATLKSQIPYGPFMLAGVLAAVLVYA